MKFKNVIVINDYAYIDGGASQVALSSAMALAGKGHNVVVFSAVAPIVPELVGVNNLTVVCTEQYEILKDPNRLRASIQGVWNLRASQALIELLQNFDPKNTVVHVHLLTKALSSSVVSVALKGVSLLSALYTITLLLVPLAVSITTQSRKSVT